MADDALADAAWRGAGIDCFLVVIHNSLIHSDCSPLPRRPCCKQWRFCIGGHDDWSRCSRVEIVLADIDTAVCFYYCSNCGS